MAGMSLLDHEAGCESRNIQSPAKVLIGADSLFLNVVATSCCKNSGDTTRRLCGPLVGNGGVQVTFPGFLALCSRKDTMF